MLIVCPDGIAVVGTNALLELIGQIVVYKGIVTVVRCPTGQFVTVGAQDVTV